MDGQLVVTGVAAAPVIVGLVAATGQAVPAMPRRLYPVLAVAFGVGWQCAAAWALGEWTAAAPLVGVIVGLAASGLYSSAVKATAALLRGAR